MSLLPLAAGLLAIATIAQAQPPAFEVASIKPSDPNKGMLGFLTYPGGRVRGGHLTLNDMVADGFDIQLFQISGGPDWAGDAKYRYDIEATVPASSASSHANPAYSNSGLNAEQREMLLTLLANRFRLKFHRETREAPELLLTQGRKPPKLEKPKDSDAFPWVGSATDQGMMTNTGIAGQNAPMSLLATRLMWYFDRPVLDETGLKGSFDFRFELPREGPPITSSRLLKSPEVVAAVIRAVEGIGLQLKTGKGPMEVVVIDHAELPSPN